MKICSACGQEIPQAEGKRICSRCNQPILRHDRWRFGADGRPKHIDCADPDRMKWKGIKEQTELLP